MGDPITTAVDTLDTVNFFHNTTLQPEHYTITHINKARASSKRGGRIASLIGITGALPRTRASEFIRDWQVNDLQEQSMGTCRIRSAAYLEGLSRGIGKAAEKGQVLVVPRSGGQAVAA